jgi:aminomethyltransferase
LVDLKKPLFNGKAALLREKANGSRYNFVKLDIDGNKAANHSYIFTKGNKFAGTVTSAMWSPSAKANIALASLEAPYGQPGEELVAEIYYMRELKWNRVMAPCRVVEQVFWDPPRRRQTPPPDY